MTNALVKIYTLYLRGSVSNRCLQNVRIWAQIAKEYLNLNADLDDDWRAITHRQRIPQLRLPTCIYLFLLCDTASFVVYMASCNERAAASLNGEVVAV